MKGMIKLTLMAELDGKRFTVFRAESIEEMRSLINPDNGYDLPIEVMVEELRPHWHLMVNSAP